MHAALFRERPWLAERPPAAESVVGMLGPREANLFYDLAQRAWTGKGTIVDAGSFLGKSAICFAEGLRSNPAFDRVSQHRIHCFDDFLCRDDATVQLIERGFGERIAVGDATRRFFDRQVQGCTDLLQVFDQDFHRVDWPAEPIEILMVDIAKTVSLGRKVVATFFEHLIPGQSLVAHQDYHHIWLPHIHVVMESLHESFELVAAQVDSTAVFAMTAPLDPARLQRCIDYDFSHEEQHDLMTRAIERVPTSERAMLELALLYLESRQRDAEELLARLDSIGDRHRDSSVPGFANDVETIANYLRHGAVREARQRGDHQAALAKVEQLLDRSPDSREAWMLRAGILLDLGRKQEAELAIDRLQAVPVDELGNRLELAQVLHGVGRHEQAEQALVDDLMAHGPALAKPGHYLDLLCSIWEQQPTDPARSARHQRLIAELTALLPNEPEVPVLAARSAFLRGDLTAAQAAMRRALELGLDSQRADSLLAPLGTTADAFVRR